MSIEQLKNQLPDYAKDTRLNLANVLTEAGAPDLSQQQIYLVALGIAYALKDNTLSQALLAEAKSLLTEEDVSAAKSAAIIMAMNNIYYRFNHVSSDKSFAALPAKLRMNVLSNPGIDKTNFELISLAISALNGCGMCIDAHTKQLIQAGMTKIGIQSAIRIASVLNATSTGLQ